MAKISSGKSTTSGIMALRSPERHFDSASRAKQSLIINRSLLRLYSRKRIFRNHTKPWAFWLVL